MAWQSALFMHTVHWPEHWPKRHSLHAFTGGVLVSAALSVPLSVPLSGVFASVPWKPPSLTSVETVQPSAPAMTTSPAPTAAAIAIQLAAFLVALVPTLLPTFLTKLMKPLLSGNESQGPASVGRMHASFVQRPPRCGASARVRPD